MKSVNFKISVIALAIGLVMASCGGGNSKKQGSTAETPASKEQVAPAKGGDKIADIADGNWQKVIKANFGVDIPLPAGWSLKEVYSPNKENNVKLFLTISGDETGESFGKKLFESTKALSPHGNYKGEIDWETNKISKGEALTDFSYSGNSENIIATWSYSFNSHSVHINYYTMGNKEAEFTFSN
jgi:hypothetical protein